MVWRGRFRTSQDTVFRAGFGIYTNQAAYSVLQNLAENEPFFLVKTVANSAKPIYTTENILNFNPTGAIGANSVNHDFAIEYNEVWNAAVQKQLKGSTSVEVDYVGSRTVHADSSTVLNVPSTFGGPRPVPQLAAFTTIRWDGWATFNAMTVQVARRFSAGCPSTPTIRCRNPWTTLPTPAPPTPNTTCRRILSPWARRRRSPVSITASGLPQMQCTSYPSRDTPRAWLRDVIGGWRAAGILTAQSGAPFTVNLSSAAGQNVSPIGLVSGNNLERPNLAGNPNSGPQTAAEWFNTAAFTVPAQNTFGSAGRNVVTGPGLATLDLSLQKDQTLHERLKLQFRFDVYNSLNHANFSLPGRIFGAANFGVVSSAGDPREMQMALKVLF